MLFLVFVLAGVDFTAMRERASSADPNTPSRDVSNVEALCAQSASLAALGGRWARACGLVKRDGRADAAPTAGTRGLAVIPTYSPMSAQRAPSAEIKAF